MPKKDFRKGVVTAGTIDKYLSKTADGYCIQLPNSTNIPTPAVINGTLYLSGGFGSRAFYAFDAVTGKNKWAVGLDDDGPSSPAISDGIIVFNTESCTIFACDMETGKPLWSYFLGDPLMSMPTIANGIVFTAYPAYYEGQAGKKLSEMIPSHVLIAIELKTGKILWQKWIDSDIMSAPVAKADLLYVTSFSGALYKVKQKTGEFIEARAIRATSAPVFLQNQELIVSRRSDDLNSKATGEAVVIGYGKDRKEVYKKNAAYLDKDVQVNSQLKTFATSADAGNGFASGAPASSNYTAAFDNIGQSNVSSLQSFQGSRSLYQNGRLYNTMGDEIICTDSSGSVKWKHKLEGDIKTEGGFMGTPPVYADGFIIVATLKGDVLVFDEKSGSPVNTYHVKDAIRYQPVADNGWIYVTTVNSKLYAINTGNPAITGWHMWGGNAERTNENTSNLP
jgi:outer membrane protein assembly factor BamB